MHTPSPLEPRGSPVPGVIPEPVRVVDDNLRGRPDRPAALRRWHPVARLLRVIRGDGYMADACAPTNHATSPTRGHVAPDVHGNVPAGVHPDGKLDATSGPRGPGTESQANQGSGMRDRHFPRLCRSCHAPMARQEDDCWRCGAPWVTEAGRSPSPSSRARAAPAHVASGLAPVVVADDPRATTEVQLAADRWADEGGSFDPNGNGLSAAPPGRRSAAASPQR